MPGDFLKPVTAGQPLRIPAAAYNAFVQTAVAHRNGLLRGGVRAADGFVDPHACAYVRNDSGQDAPQFGVLALSATMAVSPEDNESQFRSSPTFAGTAPAGDGRPFCITLAPIPAGKCGPALLSGIIPVRLDVADSAHAFADSATGNVAGLVSADAGPCRILWRGAASGVGWAVVCLNQGRPAEPPKLMWRVMARKKPGADPTVWQWRVFSEFDLGFGGADYAGLFIPVMRPPVAIAATAWTDVVFGAYACCPVFAEFQTDETTGLMQFQACTLVASRPPDNLPPMAEEVQPGLYGYRVMLGLLVRDWDGAPTVRQLHYGPVHESLFPAFFNLKLDGA